MPLNMDALTLDPGPRSVQDARRWAVEACHALGRDDLSETAELGISELVTNAILHASPPIAIRMRGTRDHPRIEVFDGSSTPPAPSYAMTEEDELLSTIGRGLGIVAMCSTSWGADIRADGKVVWFEPSVGLSDDSERAGAVFEEDALGRAGRGPVRDGIRIDLRSLPVNLYVDHRRHYRELRRELRLLSLAHESDYPVAKSISELFVRFDADFAASQGVGELDEAIRRGDDRLDLVLVVPPTAPAVMAQMIDLLELADEFCRAERLLSLATTPQQLAFQRWFLGEFVRQAQTEPPLAWAGEAHVQSYSQSAS